VIFLEAESVSNFLSNLTISCMNCSRISYESSAVLRTLIFFNKCSKIAKWPCSFFKQFKKFNFKYIYIFDTFFLLTIFFRLVPYWKGYFGIRCLSQKFRFYLNEEFPILSKPNRITLRDRVNICKFYIDNSEEQATNSNFACSHAPVGFTPIGNVSGVTLTVIWLCNLN